MNKALASLAFLLAFPVGLCRAEEVLGSYCKISETRIANPGTGISEKILWEYKEPTTSEAPVMGMVDAAGADRGVVRGSHQEFAKRISFSVSGTEGGPVANARILTAEPQLKGADEFAGLKISGLTISAFVTQRHDCTYIVSVWKSHCTAE